MNSTLVRLADNHLSVPIAPPKVLHLANHGLKIYQFKRHEYIPSRSDVLWQIKTGIVRTMTWDEEGNEEWFEINEVNISEAAKGKDTNPFLDVNRTLTILINKISICYTFKTCYFLLIY
jgi:hypothetical protein